jgi:hypothetical protein
MESIGRFVGYFQGEPELHSTGVEYFIIFSVFHCFFMQAYLQEITTIKVFLYPHDHFIISNLSYNVAGAYVIGIASVKYNKQAPLNLKYLPWPLLLHCTPFEVRILY